MKKLFTLTFFTVFIAMTANTGCTPGGGGSNNVVAALPNIANFELKAASSFVAGAASTISILSSSLGDGAFTVNYNLTGANSLSGLTATMNMSGGTGTFQTPALSTDGQMNIDITSISNSAGGSASITSNNTYAFSDSEGLMTGTYTSPTGVATPLRATHVIALGNTVGNTLSINGVIWAPNLISITLYDDLYTGSTGVVNFNFNENIPPSTTNNSVYNGSAAYGQSGSGSGATFSDLSQHGTITISTVSPLLTGSFSYTNQDSSTVVGTFSCPHP